MNIYVGNVNHQSTEQDLTDLFAQYGTVKSVKSIKDNYTGKSRGFAFVEMEDGEGASSAITALNDKEFMGRRLVVNEARPKTQSSGGGGGSRGGYGGGSGGGGFNRDRDRDRNYNN
ncbi:MAG: RNA-binding protein [Taibaiella sp.]|nr:RNA-binding protein [Taibaiella sp.]